MRELLVLTLLALSLPAFAGVNGSPPAVPEPETLALLAIGMLGLVLSRRRKK